MSVQEFDESDPQSAAVIEISNPQIYTRENLINDRRKEIERLQELLDDSKNLTFVPQVRRDLREIAGFSASLQAAFNPAAGQIAQRASERADLEQQIALKNLRTNLAAAQERLILAERRIEALEADQIP
jgi:hypothetical protein